MKNHTLMIFAILSLIFSCKPGEGQHTQKAVFGIYEIARLDEIAGLAMDSLKSLNIQMESNAQTSILGYITIEDSSVLQYEPGEKLKLCRTHFTVDEDHRYFGVVALKPGPIISNFDIQSTKSNETRVEIRFNMAGARKWADLTRKNSGKMLAFTIDNEIIMMPFIKDEIRNGAAQIDLEDAATAIKLAEMLNSTIR